MTPLEITMLLHFYAIVTPFRNMEYPAQQRIVNKFLEQELVFFDDALCVHRTTPKGDKLVEFIRAAAGYRRDELDLTINNPGQETSK